MTLFPFSLSELKAAHIEPTRKEAIFNGFMPRLYDEKVSPLDFQRNYLQTYVERDVRQMIAVKNLHAFEIFLHLLAGRIGQLVNLSSLASDTGVSSTTLKEWFSVLEASNIIFTLPCYYRNFSKRFVKTPKIYFTDSGLAAYLLGIREPEQLPRDPLFGSLFENMVVAEALKQRFNAGLGPDLYFIRDRSGMEIDLVLEQARKLHLFEIKSSFSYSPDFIKNIQAFRALTQDVLSSTVVYSGKTRRGNPDAAIINYQDFDSHLAKVSSCK